MARNSKRLTFIKKTIITNPVKKALNISVATVQATPDMLKTLTIPSAKNVNRNKNEKLNKKSQNNIGNKKKQHFLLAYWLQTYQ